MYLFCDFDGTIAPVDTTDMVLSAFAGPEWEAIEEEWVAGEISAAECMRRQVALLAYDEAALDEALDRVTLDPGFAAFVDWAEAQGFPIAIVSDGVDRSIRRILAKHGLSRLPVISNVMAGLPEARRLETPFEVVGCAGQQGVCKCAVMEAERKASPSATMVFVGDGRSDFCVSGRTDILFAKGKLIAFAREQGIAHWPFETFHDVRATLEELGGAMYRNAAAANA